MTFFFIAIFRFWAILEVKELLPVVIYFVLLLFCFEIYTLGLVSILSSLDLVLVLVCSVLTATLFLCFACAKREDNDGSTTDPSNLPKHVDGPSPLCGSTGAGPSAPPVNPGSGLSHTSQRASLLFSLKAASPHSLPLG